MKFGIGMDLDVIEVDLEGQGFRSKNKVTRVKKKHDLRALCIILDRNSLHQKSYLVKVTGSRSKVTRVLVM